MTIKSQPVDFARLILVAAGAACLGWATPAPAQASPREKARADWPADLADLLAPQREQRSGRVVMHGGAVRTYVTLRTEDDLRKMIGLLPNTRGTIVGQVFGAIALRQRTADERGRDRVLGLHVPPCHADLVLVGMTPDAGITFNMTFDGDWRSWGEGARRADNGIQFRGRRMVLCNLAFRNYNWLGGAVRTDASDSTWLHECRFTNIGSITFPTSKPAGEVENAYDTLYSGAAVGGSTPDLHLHDCTFEDVGRGNHWNHSVYPSSRSVEIDQCTFTRCGNPLEMGHCERIVIRGCTFDNQAEVTMQFLRGRKLIHGYLFYFNPKAEVVFEDNVIRGVYDDVIHQGSGRMDPSRHRFARNDYRAPGQSLGGRFWFVMGEGVRPWQAWRAAGFDADSRFPEPAPPKR
jgi:hypothetical protein